MCDDFDEENSVTLESSSPDERWYTVRCRANDDGVLDTPLSDHDILEAINRENPDRAVDDVRSEVGYPVAYLGVYFISVWKDNRLFQAKLWVVPED